MFRDWWGCTQGHFRKVSKEQRTKNYVSLSIGTQYTFNSHVGKTQMMLKGNFIYNHFHEIKCLSSSSRSSKVVRPKMCMCLNRPLSIHPSTGRNVSAEKPHASVSAWIRWLVRPSHPQHSTRRLGLVTDTLVVESRHKLNFVHFKRHTSTAFIPPTWLHYLSAKVQSWSRFLSPSITERSAMMTAPCR